MAASTFTFTNDNRYYNPLCDSELLFQDQDGDTNRIFCIQSSCIAPIFSGAVGTCDNTLKPSGYANKTFEWGTSDASWTLNANYDGFPYMTGQFVAPFQITASETGAACMVWQRVRNGTFYDANGQPWTQKYGAYYVQNPNNSFKKVVPGKAGFQPMKVKSLTGTKIDAGNAGSSILVPYLYPSPYFCNSTMYFLEKPEITYFDVGTRNVPGSNVATLKDAGIKVMPVTVAPNVDSDPFLPYGSITLGNNVNWFGYVECDSASAFNNRVAGRDYQICCAQKNAPVTVDTSYYSTDRTNLPAYRANPYNFNPDLGANNSIVGISWEDATGASTGSKTVITGYRIQKYVQKAHTINFAKGYPEIQSGARHIEAKIYPLGYKITWEFVSATPKKVITIFNEYGTGVQYNYGPPYYVPPEPYGCCYTRPGFWTRDLISITATPTAWGDVQIRFTYTPFDYSKYYEYGPMAEDNTQDISGLQNESGYNAPWLSFRCDKSNRYYDCWNQYIGFLINGGLSSGAGIGSTALITTYPRSVSTGYGFGSYTITDLLFGTSTTHKSKIPLLGNKMPDLPSDPLSPQNTSGILNFKYPLTDLYPMQLATLINGRINAPNPQPAQTSKPTQKAYLWRRLVDSIQNTVVDFTFSNRKEWFNGTCPFDVKYDNIESNIQYNPESCTASIKPYVLPTG